MHVWAVAIGDGSGGGGDRRQTEANGGGGDGNPRLWQSEAAETEAKAGAEVAAKVGAA